MKKYLLLFSITISVSVACSKSSNEPKFCWDCVNEQGVIVAEVCDKSLSEIEDMTRDHTPYSGCAKHQ